MIQMISALVTGKASVLNFRKDVMCKHLRAQVFAGKGGPEIVDAVPEGDRTVI